MRFLQGNPQELELLFKELLIGVTSFFRDPAAWEHLKEAILALLADRPSGQVLRAWVPGCSTGEEAYSLAIVFKEALDQVKHGEKLSLQIFATDLDREAIDRARQGVFPANISADVSPERLKRFFVKEEDGYRVSKEIREMVVFATQNIVMDPPFTKLDILSCRNLLIYLAPELQKKLVPLFHYSLNPGGILFLGSAETVGTYTDLFSPLDGKSRLYRRLDSALRAEPVEFPSSFVSPPVGSSGARPEGETRRSTSSRSRTRCSCSGIPRRRCWSTTRATSSTSAAGRASTWNLRPARQTGTSLPWPAKGCVTSWPTPSRRRLRQKGAVTLKNLKVGTNGGVQTLDLTVQVLAEPERFAGHGNDRLYGRRRLPWKRKPRAEPGGPLRRRPAGPDGGGGPAGPRGAAYYPRRDADLPGRAEIGQ